MLCFVVFFFFFQAEDGIRDRSPSRGLGDVYKRQGVHGLPALHDEIHTHAPVQFRVALPSDDCQDIRSPKRGALSLRPVDSTSTLGFTGAQTLIPLRGLLPHIVYFYATYHAFCKCQIQNIPRFIGVDVKFHLMPIAHHQQTIAHACQSDLKAGRIHVVAGYKSARAISEPAGLLIHVRTRRYHTVIHMPYHRLLSGIPSEHALEHSNQPVASGINHTRITQHCYQAWSIANTLPTRRDSHSPHVHQLPFRFLLSAGGHVLDHGQHGAFYRLPHCTICGIPSLLQRLNSRLCVERSPVFQDFHATTHDLRKDYPTVSAGTHERRLRHFLRNLRGRRFFIQPVKHLHDALDSQTQIGSSVTIRHRVYVEVIDLLPASFKRAVGRTHGLPRHDDGERSIILSRQPVPLAHGYVARLSAAPPFSQLDMPPASAHFRPLQPRSIHTPR